jgi:hypothetical protein
MRKLVILIDFLMYWNYKYIFIILFNNKKSVVLYIARGNSREIHEWSF